MNPANEHDDSPNTKSVSNDLGRLIDELVAYIRTRRKFPPGESGRTKEVDEERLLRAALRHLRRHPIPTTLLGVSVTWLLLAKDDDNGDEIEPPIAPEVEDEIVKQIKGGYDYTNERLRNLIDRYPIAAAAAIVGGGLLASFLLPNRSPQASETYPEPEPVDDEVMPGEDYGFTPLEEDE